MSCLGVHFALTESDVEQIRSIGVEKERIYHIHDIEESLLSGDKLYAAESDKSWDGMHRALSDGKLTWDGGEYPLNHTVLAGELLYSGVDYIMSLKTPDQVVAISAALKNLDEALFRERYYRIDASDYDVELEEDDFEYTWSYFQGVRDLYSVAAKEGKYVLFTADQ